MRSPFRRKRRAVEGMVMKKICCVNDMPGVGKIAMSAMVPILSAEGLDVACLPTALVSNPLNFGKYHIFDTSDYIEKTVDVWHTLGFRFDCIATGFMVNPRQVRVVEKLIHNQADPEPLVVVDPIMGDKGKLYNGMGASNVEIMRKLSGYADILIPNFTESCFLTDCFFEDHSLTSAQAKELLNKCRGLGAKSVVITSAFVNGKNCVVGYDHKQNETFEIGFERIDVPFLGTGDTFSAVLIAEVLSGSDLYTATAHAMQVVRDRIQESYAGG